MHTDKTTNMENKNNNLCLVWGELSVNMTAGINPRGVKSISIRTKRTYEDGLVVESEVVYSTKTFLAVYKLAAALLENKDLMDKLNPEIDNEIALFIQQS